MPGASSSAHRRELVALLAHAVVREPLLFHRAVIERIVERTGRMKEGTAPRVAIQPWPERPVAEKVVARFLPRLLVALPRVGGKLVERRVRLYPSHRRARATTEGKHCDPAASHAP